MAFDLLHDLVWAFVAGVASSAVVVALGLKPVRDHLRAAERKRLIRDLADFWTPLGDSRTFNIVVGKERVGGEEIEPRFGYAEAYSMVELADCLELVFAKRVHLNFTFRHREDAIDQELFNDNVIILGGELTIEQFGQFSREMGVPYYQYHLDPKDRCFETPESSPSEQIRSLLANGSILADFGTVTRLINPSNRNLIVLYNGNYCAGLFASVLSTTASNRFHKGGFNSSIHGQQLLVRVSNIRNNIIDKNHLVEAIRGWIPFSVSEAAIANAIANKHKSVAIST